MKRTSVFVWVVLAIFCSNAAAQSPGEKSYHDESILPKGEIGARIESILAVYNSNDPERIGRFITEECTAEFRDMVSLAQHIEVWRGEFLETGGLAFHGIRRYVPERNNTVVILKDRNYGGWRAAVVEFDASQGNRVGGLRFTRARTPSNVSESKLTESQFIESVAGIVKSLNERDVFSGAVLVAKGDKVLLARAGGEASKRFHVPNNTETRFNLGSMNKMFTSTAIMQLARKGMLALDDPIGKYIDETWLSEDVTNSVTVRHLLTHTSGLGNYFNDIFWKGSRTLYRSVEDFKPLVEMEELAFEPGTEFRYSNTGMLLLGVVIEQVTGQSYFDHIRSSIFEPAGMMNTGSFEMDHPVENLAIGYSPNWENGYGWENNLYKHVVKGGPAGGGFSTVGDLLKFARAIQRGELVTPASLQMMWEDQSGEGYGFGFRVDVGPAGKVVGHSGGFDGINGNLDIFLENGYIVAVLSNIDNGANPLAARIGQLLMRVGD